MLVSSILNPSARSSVHLFIVHYNDGRVLVPVDLHAKYSDLQGFVTKTWGLEGHVFFFETDELDVCAGRRVRIHEEAWLGIKDIVGNVHVRLLQPNFRTQLHEHKPRELLSDTFSNRISETNLGNFVRVALASLFESECDEFGSSRQPSESADEDEVEQQTRPEIQKSDYVVVTPTGGRLALGATEDGHEDLEVPGQSPRKVRPEGDALNLFNDEGDTNGVRDKAEREDHMTEPTPSKEVSVSNKPSWKHLQGSGKTATPSRHPTGTTTTTPRPALVTPTPGPRSTDTETKNESEQLMSNSTINEDTERVLLIVEPPPDSVYESRTFRIRRTHSVRTFLKGASRAFNIDFTRARLRMVIEDESEALVTVKCDFADTMASLKVEDNQRFIIEMVDEDEEDEESDY